MKYITNSMKICLLLAFSAIVILAASCNKAPETIPGAPSITPPTLNTLGAAINAIPSDSLYYKVIVKAGLLSILNTPSLYYTMFVPDNNAVKVFINFATGGAIPLAAPDQVFAAFINSSSFSAASANGIVSYNTCPQPLYTTSVPATFPNFQYPSILNPAPAISTLLRLTIFPSTINGNWVNNVPLSAVNTSVANGVIHQTAAVVVPPSRYLWDRISTDANLTYLQAAILRADSGVAVSNPGSLVGALQNIGANLTVFAPANAAFQGLLTAQITAALIAQGVPPAIAAAQAAFLASTPAVFSNPALYSVLTSQTVKGIIVYHVLGVRAFTNNFPTTATFYPTLLNGAIPVHPGVKLTCTFAGLNVSTGTVKGVANATAASIAINPFPEPFGTSDQHYLNGTLHVINQVLLPQ